MRIRNWVLVGLVFLLVGSMAQAQSEPRVMDMEFKDAPIVDVFQILGELAGWNVLVDPSVSGQLSFYLQDLPVSEALDLIAKTTGFGYRMVGNTLVVATEQRLDQEFSTTGSSFIPVQHVNVSDVARLLNVVSPAVRVYGDERLNLIVLHGTEEQVRQAREAIRQYDQPQFFLPETEGEVERPQYERVLIPVEYQNGERLNTQLRSLYPDMDIQWLAEGGSLAVRAAQRQVDEIRAWIRERDVPSFRIRGIVSHEETVLVLVEHEGVTDRIRVGGSIIGWTVAEVDEKNVTFVKEGRSFSAAMGR